MSLSDPPCDCDKSCTYDAETFMWPRFDKGPKRWRLCPYCGKSTGGWDHPITSVDHIVPRSKGGGDKAYNLVDVCRLCNQEKGNLFLLEWLWALERACDSRAGRIRKFLKCKKHKKAFDEMRAHMNKSCR